MRPIIGITSLLSCCEANGEFTFVPEEYHLLGDSYVTAIEKAGGIPMILPSFRDPSLMEEAVSCLDGVLLSGGFDIDPALYGEPVAGTSGPVSVRCDAAGMALVKYVMSRTQLPVLGICRGAQLVNVAEGGSLIQDLRSAGKGEHRLNLYPRNYPAHGVKLEAGSRLADIFGGEEIRTNSFHHQAIRETAPGWKVTAVSAADGVIEAVEKPGERFAVCVQWHPEAMYDTDAEQALFRAFVDAAKRAKQ